MLPFYSGMLRNLNHQEAQSTCSVDHFVASKMRKKHIHLLVTTSNLEGDLSQQHSRTKVELP